MFSLRLKVSVALPVPYSDRGMARTQTQSAEAGTSTPRCPNRRLRKPTQTMVEPAAQSSTEGQMAR
jgi:hypothetical protein